ncbi:WD40 repeat protein [Kibdelosporangium banguiense]|uniref:WD40 repeat protein n=1 Tax=Kibdelosporangium banguiense TaxID=1365924 RepID=A0ABS4TWN1_9PSEU|nr:WD40 repeat domain-containing protein [Kibdelosporangium banguiense]MBP2328818.1 WD40 repeat protein [Kibdelosporangium banguiense]
MGTGGHEQGSMLPGVPSIAPTVAALGQTFVDYCGLAPGNLTTVLDPGTPNELGEALMAAATRATDTLVLYFVCHGVIGNGGRLYLATLATTDIGHGLLRYQAFPYEDLREVVEQTTARSTVVVLDCCFAGRAHGVTGNVMDSLSATAQEKGFYLLAAAGRDEHAWAPENERHTAFSGEVIRLLRNGDPGGPDVFTLDQVYQALSAKLADKGFPRPRRQAADHTDMRPFARNAAARPPKPEPDRGDEGSPYRGLAYFRPEDAGYFFGRDRLIDDLVARIGERQPLLVTGSSGVGKSSLLRAGLVPAVGRMTVAPRWEWQVLTPGSDPFWELAIRLSASAGVSTGVLRERLQAKPGALADVLVARNRTGTRMLLVVDQFEELFTSCEDESVRRRFIEELSAAGSPGPDGREPAATVVICLRAGFFGICASYPELVPALQRPVVVTPLDDAEIREVIEKPADRAKLVVEPQLVDRLLEDVGGTGAAARTLPLLSHALLSTWQVREGNRLTLRGYLTTGGIEQALAKTADSVIDELDPDSRDIARRLLLQLVQVGVGTADSRRKLPSSKIGAEPGVRKVLDKLVRARLVSVDEDFVQITHDALLRAWPRLRDWIADSRADLLVHRQLSEAAATWEDENRDPASLLSRNRLAAVDSQLREDSGESLGQREREFLNASRRQVRKARRLRKIGVAVLAVLLVMSSLAAVYAIWQERIADRQRDVAEASLNRAHSLATARTAADMRGVDPAVAMQLGVAAFRTHNTPEARSAVLSSVTLPLPVALMGHTGGVVAAAFRGDGAVVATGAEDNTVRLWDIRADPRHPVQLAKLERHTGPVYEAVFDRGGQLLATASGDRTVKLWDVSDPRRPVELSTLAEHTNSVRGLAIAPDGRTIATASADRMIRLWAINDPGKPALLARIPGHQDVVRSVSFLRDGLLASASEDRTAKIWDITNPSQPKGVATLPGHTDTVRVVPFAPGRNLLATASNDRTVKLWDIAGKPVELATLTGHTDAIRGAAFSPDGRTLATGSADTMVKLWDVSDPAHPIPTATLSGHTNAVNWVTFSPDGRTLATTSADQSGKLWNVSDPRHPASMLPPLGGHTGTVRATVFSPDGKTLATASEDRTARLWDISNPGAPTALATLPGHKNTVNALAFKRDGQLLATASDDGTAKLWDVGSQPVELATLGEHTDTVKSVAFSPDGSILATVSGDQTARLWDVTHPRQPVPLDVLRGHTSYVFGVAFSPDGQTLATVSEDRTLRLWDVVDPRQARQIAVKDDHGSTTRGVAFSPDGLTLATASDDRTARLWDVSDPRRPVVMSVLSSHVGQVFGVAFGDGGRTVVTTSEDKTAKVWDVSDRAKPVLVATLVGHTNVVYGVSFAPGSSTIATASWDSTVQLWNTEAQAVADLVCSTLNTRITEDQWRQVLPDVPFQSPCP